MEGKAQHVSAPTTLVLRRQDGEWKLALFHSVPLPEEG
jgi:ketosteroid isomerase-like protein